ncbi:TPA: cytochrome d ubiquinol oxidase subunit II, partial [Klebsiella variicola subsp. variicola]|nr:cytochrome d ubiquinol oxidase subunit II [Klebsiella variicola subsp. variicola]
AGLFGAFPLAYAVITDALVIPLTAMLIGLIFRGVAFEFRFKAVPSHRTFWDYAFAGGSLLATFSQGIVVGAFINGFAVADRRFAGSTLDWLTPFNLFCGLGLVVAYLLLGTTWLIMKSEGALQQRMRELTRKVLLALMVVIAVVSVWTPLGWRYVAERWFTLPNFFWFVPVPILVLALSLWIWRLSARPASHARPFILTLGLIFLGFSGLGISVWPNIIPPNISLWDAAAPP